MRSATDFSALVAGIYECVVQPEGWAGVLEGLQREVGAVSSYLLIHGTHPLDRNMAVLVERNVDGHMRCLYNEHYISLNPLLPYLASVAGGQVYSCRHLVTQPEYLRSPFYREWAEPQGWFDYAGVTIVRQNHSSAAIGFTRAKQDHVFSDASLQLLDLLAPHLVRAAQIQNLLGLERQHRRDLASLVEAAQCAILIVDSEARVVEANPAAEVLLARNEGQIGKRGLLFAGKPVTALTDAVRAACSRTGTRCGSTILVKRRPGRRPIVLYVLPLAEPASSPFMRLYQARAAVFVLDPEFPPTGTLVAFAASYQFTPAECQVIERLACGDSPPEIAKALKIGLATVRTHLHRLFEKTSTRRQAELIALLWGSSPPIRKR